MKIIFILLFFCWGTAFGQTHTSRTVISIPSKEDLKSITFVDSMIRRDQLLMTEDDEQTYVVLESIGLFSLKGGELYAPDTINLYCPDQFNAFYGFYKSPNLKVYGASLTSDFIRYLRFFDQNYEEIDEMARELTGEPFERLYYWKHFNDCPQLIPKIVELYELDTIEHVILTYFLLEQYEECLLEKLDPLFHGGCNVFWVHDWNYKIELVQGYGKINIIPVINPIGDNNYKKRRKNRIRGVTGEEFELVQWTQLPNKITINDFVRRLKRKDLRNDVNIAIPSSEPCR